MSQGLLAVVGNPRRGGKKKKSRGRRRKASSHKKVARRPHTANPAPRRRRRANARRRHKNPHHRRRHRNPLMGGGILAPIIKGATVGVGALAAKVASNAVNNLAFGGKLAGPAKIGLEAGVGVAGYLALKAFKQPALASAFAVGAGIVVAFDLYDSYVKGMLPAQLQDYSYGVLQGWAPQAAISGWAPQAGMSAYSEGSLQGAGYEDSVYS